MSLILMHTEYDFSFTHKTEYYRIGKYNITRKYINNEFDWMDIELDIDSYTEEELKYYPKIQYSKSQDCYYVGITSPGTYKRYTYEELHRMTSAYLDVKNIIQVLSESFNTGDIRKEDENDK